MLPCILTATESRFQKLRLKVSATALVLVLKEDIWSEDRKEHEIFAN